MEILKQHYEKIVLGALLLGFVFALVYLLQMVESARKVTAEDLKFTAPNKKYELKDFTAQEFAVDYLLGTRAQWEKRTDAAKLGFTAELSVPMKALRCQSKITDSSICGQIVPWDIAKNKKICPFCGNKFPDDLGDPPDYESEIARLDSDGDGMPDRYELKMGFNPSDANDAEQDKDGDGFSNLYEFMVKTDPTNIASKPSLEKCLFLYRLIQKTMPLMLNGVTVIPDPADKNSKKNWDISLTVNGMRESLLIGQEFTVDTRKYKIIDAEYRTRDVQDSSVVLDNDASRVTVAPVVDGQVNMAGKMVLEVGKKVYEPNHQAEIRDIRNPRRAYRKSLEETFTVKGENEAENDKGVTFQLIATDAVAETVTIQNMEGGEPVLLHKTAKLPRNAYVKKDGTNASFNMPVAPLPENENNMPRRRRRTRN